MSELAPFDEAFEGGAPRAAYSQLIEAIEDAGPAGLAAEAEQRATELGLSFKMHRFRLDPVPRLIGAEEWERIAAAAAQRSRALNAFAADAYGERRIVAEGIVPERVIETAEHYEPAMRDVPAPPASWVTVVGLDLARGPDGNFQVLEDNGRSPSGLSFSAAAREALAPAGLPGLPASHPSLAFDLLGEALRAAAPAGGGEPTVALFSEGPGSGAFFEHAGIARRLGIPIVTTAELEASGDRLHGRVGGVRTAIDVLYRRVDGERLTKADGRPTALGRLLIEPLHAGSLTVVNAFGSGVVDDKLTHAYVEQMIGFYLGEEPLLPSIPTYDLGDPDKLAPALERLGELVIKPREGLGGGGVVIGPLASAEELEATRARVQAAPGAFVAQETVPLSTHPTVAGDALEPRHVDLRPYAIAIGDRVEVPKAALTRFAPERGEMIVNSSRGGGAKDTWVIEK